MSITTCALSGTVLEHPVISKKSGHVFEKRLIEKHIDATGQCPITGVNLEKEDLLDIQVPKAAKPRPLTATNIPGILNILQSEWDTLMLETYTLKQHLDSVRQELAHALYQHDAACRVICRLMKEKEELNGQLATIQSKLQEFKYAGAQSSEQEEKEDCGIYPGLVKKMETVNENLSERRKRKQPPVDLATSEMISKFQEASSNPVHSSTKEGITSLDIHPWQEKLILTGGVDKNGVLFDWESGKVLKTIEYHKKRINKVKFVPSQRVEFLLCSADNTASFWQADIENSKYEMKYLVKSHTNSVTSCTFHPINDYAVFGSKDASWSIHNIYQGVKLQTVPEETPIHSVEFHPDGLMLATGLSNGVVNIWDLRASSKVFNFKGNAGDVHGLSFSEKGYYLAACENGDNSARIWDLRKIENPPSIISLEAGNTVQSVAFDPTGSYITLSGDRVVNVYLPKTWKQIASLSTHQKLVTDAKFSKNCQFLATCSLDRFLKIYKYPY